MFRVELRERDGGSRRFTSTLQSVRGETPQKKGLDLHGAGQGVGEGIHNIGHDKGCIVMAAVTGTG